MVGEQKEGGGVTCRLVTVKSCPKSSAKGARRKVVLSGSSDHHTRQGARHLLPLRLLEHHYH